MRFEALRETLLHGGIAPRHVRRYLRELDDHLADLIEAQGAAGHDEEDATARALALLGSERELAAAMLAQPNLKSLPARFPWLVFGVAPPLMILAGCFVTALSVVLIADLHGWMGHAASPGWFRSLAHGAALFANLVLAPALSILLVQTAGRQRLHWVWPFLGIVLITALGVHMTVHFPGPGQRGGQIGIELMEVSRMLKRDMGTELPLVLTQLLLTLLPVLMLLRRRHLPD